MRFLFDLARELGKTVGELESMSSVEFTHWRAYYRIRADEMEHARERAKTRQGMH